jgi:hypothetical protein
LDDYQDALTACFRNGDTSPSILTFTSNDVTIAYVNVEKHKKLLSDLERERKKTDRAYNDLIRSIEGAEKAFGKDKDIDGVMTGLNPAITGPEVAGPLLTALGSYYKGVLQVIRDTCSAHAMAYAAKLEALKECYKQDMVNLYTAIDTLLADPVARRTKG